MTTRIAIFSDLHGNNLATESVLAAIDAEAPDAVFCLGDLVGYGAHPNETVALIQDRGIPTSIVPTSYVLLDRRRQLRRIRHSRQTGRDRDGQR